MVTPLITSGETAPPDQVVAFPRDLERLDSQLIGLLAALLQNEDDLETRASFMHALLEAALTDDEARDAFLAQSHALLAAIVRSAVKAPDVVALGRRLAVLTEFERLLSEPEHFDAIQIELGAGPEKVWQTFIEENPWIIGSSLAPQFLHSWSAERLEQTVKGFSLEGPGKRADAVLRTAGALSAVVLAEIKHHRTGLVTDEYRPGVWRIGKEVVGGVAQCQATADEAERTLGKTVDLKTVEGHSAGRAFVCRPRTVLVAGSLTQFVDVEGNAHHAKFESFERFRRGLRDPEIITFDELYERARLTLALVEPIET